MQDRDGDFDRYFFVRDGNCAEIGERAADDQAVLVLCALLRDGRSFRAVARVQRASAQRRSGTNLRSVLEVAVDVSEAGGSEA